MSDWNKAMEKMAAPKVLKYDDSLFEHVRKQELQKSLHENPILAIRPAIEQQIKAFEAELEKLDDPSLYVGLWLASFGQQRLILVQQIEFDEPCLIVFHGFSEDGSPLKLIQHVSQLSFLLEAHKHINDEPRRPIGFINNDNS